MSAARKSILARIDRTITDDSTKESDGKFLQKACIASDYQSVEFKYIKTRMENKYGFKFKSYYKRAHVVEEWDKIKESLSVAGKAETKKPVISKKKVKLKTIKDEDWSKTSVEDLSPSQALERYNKLRDEDKKRRLLEEVRNVELLW